ncbi:MAG: class I SAM-dependent methyltransferase [Candidatus Zixiibacteriota bacterium]|nr:MAG: class I SAM-dependent methyltransferase [candidate division Zixibacteria bacterium]
MLDQAIRFGAILAQPEFEAAGRLLEVGSGFRGITAFVRQPVVGVDVNFSETPTATLTALRASATELPLKDRSFDGVVCSDMLEHLPEGTRAAAIREMLRVTRGALFLACPCGRSARRVDALLGRLYRALRVPLPAWLQEHLALGLPEPAAIRRALNETGARWREIPGENALMHFLVVLLISTRIFNRFWNCWLYRNPGAARRLGTSSLLSGRRLYRRLWVVQPAEFVQKRL